VPPQPAVTAPAPPAPPRPRPRPEHVETPTPSVSERSQPNRTRNTADESRTLEATLEKLRALQRQTEPPRAVYNPPRGGAPGGGQPTGADNAKLSSAVRGAIGDKLRECYEQDTGARDYASQSVKLRVTTDETGTIRMAELAPGEGARIGVARAFAERAIRTALSSRCATLPLPRSMLGGTHTFDITFKP
jgi:outer membrane biosynthesis protein TonB